MRIIAIILEFVISLFLVYALSQVVSTLNIAFGFLFVIVAIGIIILWLFKEIARL